MGIKNRFLTENTEKLTRLARYFPHYVFNEIVDPIHEIEKQSWASIDMSNTMLDFIFARAMKRFADRPEVNEHIYLRKFEIPQIQLFELLIKKYPMVNMAQQCANTIACNYLKNWEDAILMDIGAGTGYQIREVIKLLEKQPDKVTRKLTVIAVEPFADALISARHNVEEVAKEVSFEVVYIEKNAFAEKLSVDELLDLLPKGSSNLLVNASFALHHIRSDKDRLHVVENLRSLPTKALILSEPNVDHYEGNYYQRFKNCLHHFSHVFEIIDRLEITPYEKNALKMFFSREIDDILGSTEDSRVEKHYATSQWLSTLQDTGFIPVKKDIDFLTEPILDVSLNNSYYDYWSIRYHTEDLISIILAEPIDNIHQANFFNASN